MSSRKQRVVVVMPAWNEGKNIGEMVDKLVDKEFGKIPAEMHLLVVDNYSEDDTAKIVEAASKTRKNLHIIQQGKDTKGLGWAYVKGFEYAMETLKADAVMEMDADGQHPPEFVAPMVQAYLDGAEYVVGSRYIPGGSIPKEWGMSRKFMSFFGNLFIRMVWLNFKIHDATTGFRLTKVKGVLDKIKLRELKELRRFAYKVDLLYQSLKNSKKTVEVPLEFRPRLQEQSKFNIKETIVTMRLALILGIIDKQRFIKFAVVGFTGFIVNFLFLRFFRGMGFSEILSWLFSTEMAIISNYTLNNIWTFRDAKIGGLVKTIRKFAEFNVTSAGALVIQSIAGPIGVGLVGAQYDFVVLAVVVAFMVLPYNYFMYNVVIWRTVKLGKKKKK